MLEMFLLAQAICFLIIFAVTRFAVGKWTEKRKPGIAGSRYPPSLPSVPIVGSLPFLRNLNNIAAFLMEKAHELGPIYAMHAGSKYVLILNSKEVIEEALVKNSRSFSSRPDMYTEVIGNRNRKGIAFTASTPERRRTHQVSLSILKEFGFGVKNVMEERILAEVETMSDFVLKKRGRAFDPRHLCLHMSSNIIMNIVFGRRRDYDLELSNLATEIERFETLLNPLFDIAPFARYIPLFNRKLSELLGWSRKMYDLIEKEIELSLEDQFNSCFVRRYIEKQGLDYDREGLNYLLRDMVSGGANTVANTFQWAFAILADHSEVQERLRSEVDSTIPRGSQPTLGDEIKLPYVEATSLELLRFRTLLPLGLLHATSSEAILNGYYVPAYTMIITNLYAAHNDPSVWNDPDVFRPERFLDKDNNVINKDRIIPFGLGRRSCFGEILARAEIFLILTSLIQRFIILPPEGQEKVNVKAVLPVSVVLVPGPYSIRILQRQ